jgi:hypothetical protein
MREGNKKTRNALKYLVRWKVVDLTQPSKRSISSEQSPAERSRAVNYGGIGAIHLMGQIGLAEEINARVELLKRHLPYQESDHVLNLV